MPGETLVAAAAANMAAWHTACLRALHVASETEPALWSTSCAAPFIYLSAITLGGPEHAALHAKRSAALTTQRPGGMGINDTWSTLDLSGAGFERHAETWFLRPPGPAQAPPMDGQIERPSTPDALVEFEAVHHAGFESPVLHDYGPLGVYGRDLLDEPSMHLFAIRDSSGAMVSVATACVAAGVVGIYGVATPPEYRRRGYGAAVTVAALNVAPDLPAVLQPSEMGEPVYRRIGFEPLAPVVNWIRRA